MQEPCRQGPDVTPNMAPLQRAIRESGLSQASLVVIVLLNPCGEVRDASFQKSSRNRAIDRAAIRWVRAARYSTKAKSLGNGIGGYGLLPFDFSNENDSTPGSGLQTESP